MRRITKSDNSPSFTLFLGEERLHTFDVVGVFGNVKQLGTWHIPDAPLLTQTDKHNEFQLKILLPANAVIYYRYFIAAVDPITQERQLRFWETHFHPRQCQSTPNEKRVDNFGWIDVAKREVQHGWLNMGYIVQFKLFHKALQWDTSNMRDKSVHIKLEPIDATTEVNIISSACAQVLYSKYEYGHSHLSEQPEFGVLYEPNDIIIYHITVLDVNAVTYKLKIFVVGERPDTVHLAAYQHIDPKMLDQAEGKLCITLKAAAKSEINGHLTMEYIIIRSSAVGQHGPIITFVDYWSTLWSNLNIGHCGICYSSSKTRINQSKVSTISTILDAYIKGADLVEITIMLTNDLVPIVYHNFQVKALFETQDSQDFTEISIADLTHEQLSALKIYRLNDAEMDTHAAPNTIDDETERLFPTLQYVLSRTDPLLGLNLEIKWPQPLHAGGNEGQFNLNKNQYLDIIINVVEQNCHERYCFYSSYDMDICTMLRYKQNMYPVISNLAKDLPKYADPRTHNFYGMLNTAQAFELKGIVAYANIYKRNPEVVKATHKQNKVIILWGKELNDLNTIEKFRKMGVNGFYCDNLELFVGKRKENVFENDTELEELWRLKPNSTIK